MIDNVIGIIPCKKNSERLPNKNTLPFGNKMLFEWSVDYALSGGITPVVSTDNELVMDWCIAGNIPYVVEDVEDSNICNCIDQVLKEISCDRFVLLQPTSPIRQVGLLKELLSKECKTSIYTADKVKIIGHMEDKFMEAYRDQADDTKFLYHFDGNTVIVNNRWYQKAHKLFSDESEYVVQGVPYSLQIDTYDDYKTLNALVTYGKY